MRQSMVPTHQHDLARLHHLRVRILQDLDDVCVLESRRHVAPLRATGASVLVRGIDEQHRAPVALEDRGARDQHAVCEAARVELYNRIEARQDAAIRIRHRHDHPRTARRRIDHRVHRLDPACERLAREGGERDPCATTDREMADRPLQHLYLEPDRIDVGDRQPRELLAMAGLAAVALLRLELEDDQLLAAEVLVEEPSEATAETDEAETAETEDTTDGPQPVLVLDDEQLTDALAQNNSEFASTNQDATVELTGSPGSGQPEVVPGSVGRGVDGEQVVDEILADLNGEQSRTITVELQEIEPEITTEDAEAWDVNHVQAEYATPYPPEDGPRTANLRVGADRINGTVIMPGEEFNLNALLAPVTEANGYYQSGVVESGVTTTAVGGGLSQIATMAYNAGFLGGMDIVEHKPHSRWFDRYPQGRESTYWEGQINVRWANDTDAPVIVEMWLADNQVHTRLWGSDYYDVETSTSDPYNHTASPTIRSSDDECIPERGGREGFTVDVHRTKTPPGGDPIRESWSWAYSGWPTVICE